MATPQSLLHETVTSRAVTVGDVAKWALLLWMSLVIWAAFFWVRPAEGFIGQSSRIVFFHVPFAWVAVLAFLVSCVTSV